MGWERFARSFSRIVLVVIIEYALLILLFFLAIRFLDPTAAQVASAAAVLFGALTLANFLLAHRLFGGRYPPTLARHLTLLRDDFVYLRWYFDEILETMSSSVIVLDRLLTVRSLNHAGRSLLSLREKEELVGRPFRIHPLSKEVYTGEIYGYRGKHLIDVFEACAREGSSILLEKVPYRRSESEDPVILDVLVHPWKNRQDDTERLVIRVDEHRANGDRQAGIDIERLLAAVPPPPARPAESNGAHSQPELRKECAAVRDHLQALLSSSQSIGQVLGPEDRGPRAELLLFEMQVKRILDMIGRMEAQIGKGAS
jgi:PAS domain-containing protein